MPQDTKRAPFQWVSEVSYKNVHRIVTRGYDTTELMEEGYGVIEVLFVDYIAEHLNPNGRAGIIVPEGVIVQSGKAYKELRKMLVENYLYAVVSLPAGVFNPYSGVKTSILLMDNAIAKKSNKIIFIKIENDGYNLGAQRTVIKG